MVVSATINSYVVTANFIGRGLWSTRGKPTTCRMLVTTFIIKCCIDNTSLRWRLSLATRSDISTKVKMHIIYWRCVLTSSVASFTPDTFVFILNIFKKEKRRQSLKVLFWSYYGKRECHDMSSQRHTLTGEVSLVILPSIFFLYDGWMY